MAKITLVRHGQASFGASNYDELSPLGRHQAELLGGWWKDCEHQFDGAWSGELERQKDTAALSLAISQPESPMATALPNFDEYSTERLFVAYKPILDRDVPEVKDSAQPFIQDPAIFFRVLDTVHKAWVSGVAPAIELDGFETWQQFRDRIMSGLEMVADSVGKGSAVVFTSGGVISLVTQQLFDMNPTRQFSINWRVANSGCSEIFHRPTQGFTVHNFNAIPHLQRTADKSKITYR